MLRRFFGLFRRSRSAPAVVPPARPGAPAPSYGSGGQAPPPAAVPAPVRPAPPPPPPRPVAPISVSPAVAAAPAPVAADPFFGPASVPPEAVAVAPEPAPVATPQPAPMTSASADEPAAEPAAPPPVTFPTEEGRLPHEEAVGTGPRVRMVLADGTVAAPDDPEIKERLAYLADNILKSDRSR